MTEPLHDLTQKFGVVLKAAPADSQAVEPIERDARCMNGPDKIFELLRVTQLPILNCGFDEALSCYTVSRFDFGSHLVTLEKPVESHRGKIEY